MPPINYQPKVLNSGYIPKAASALTGGVPKKELLASYRQQIAKYMIGVSPKADSPPAEKTFKIDLSKLNLRHRGR